MLLCSDFDVNFFACLYRQELALAEQDLAVGFVNINVKQAFLVKTVNKNANAKRDSILVVILSLENVFANPTGKVLILFLLKYFMLIRNIFYHQHLVVYTHTYLHVFAICHTHFYIQVFAVRVVVLPENMEQRVRKIVIAKITVPATQVPGLVTVLVVGKGRTVPSLVIKDIMALVANRNALNWHWVKKFRV